MSPALTEGRRSPDEEDARRAWIDCVRECAAEMEGGLALVEGVSGFGESSVSAGGGVVSTGAGGSLFSLLESSSTRTGSLTHVLHQEQLPAPVNRRTPVPQSGLPQSAFPAPL
jgi:hypothetical protein